MTVASQVKQCLASLQSLEAGFNQLQTETKDEEAHDVFRKAALKIRTVAQDVEKRVYQLEIEEPQYKN
ncbi:DUF1657 domain-containing protein [Alteribacter populi]|uniref:DUF1657 domain-containing protein n=1 Tax=Alteribacter populi TaxID=2011011 RepID=UPI000BBA58CB|nr:DUF1657 domain-containing protein [Alteribacter populi]